MNTQCGDYKERPFSRHNDDTINDYKNENTATETHVKSRTVIINSHV